MPQVKNRLPPCRWSGCPEYWSVSVAINTGISDTDGEPRTGATPGMAGAELSPDKISKCENIAE